MVRWKGLDNVIRPYESESSSSTTSIRLYTVLGSTMTLADLEAEINSLKFTVERLQEKVAYLERTKVDYDRKK